MIIEYVRYTIPEPDGARFRASYPEAGKILAADPHCLQWELRRCVEHPDQHVIRVDWDSQEGHEQGFREAPAYEEFRSLVRQFAQYRDEIAHYSLVADGSGGHVVSGRLRPGD